MSSSLCGRSDLLTTAMAEGTVRAAFITSRSSAVSASPPLKTARTRRDASAARRARSTPSCSTVSPVSRIPAVSDRAKEYAAYKQLFLDGVACCAGDICHDSALKTNQRVKKRRFADIRPADDRPPRRRLSGPGPGQTSPAVRPASRPRPPGWHHTAPAQRPQYPRRDNRSTAKK